MAIAVKNKDTGLFKSNKGQALFSFDNSGIFNDIDLNIYEIVEVNEIPPSELLEPEIIVLSLKDRLQVDYNGFSVDVRAALLNVYNNIRLAINLNDLGLAEHLLTSFSSEDPDVLVAKDILLAEF